MFASFVPEIMDIVGRRERYGGTYDKPVGVRYVLQKMLMIIVSASNSAFSRSRSAISVILTRDLFIYIKGKNTRYMLIQFPTVVAWEKYHWEKKWSQNGTTLEPGWSRFGKRYHFENGDVFSLIITFNSSTFEGGTKIVPGVELSYIPWNGFRGGAVLDQLFMSVIYIFSYGSSLRYWSIKATMLGCWITVNWWRGGLKVHGMTLVAKAGKCIQ